MDIYDLAVDPDILLARLDVNFSTPAAKHALAHLQTICKEAPVIPDGNFSYRHGDDYYMAMDKLQLVRINAQGITIVPNASQVYVRLSGEPWEYAPSSDGIDYLVQVVKSLMPEASTADVRAKFLVAVIVALILDANVPLVVITSGPGSGKTTLVNCLLKLLFGQSAGVSRIPTKEQDLVTALHAKRVVGLDNLEGTAESTLDLLCSVVTGGKITHRKLFTDKETVELVIRNLVMITAVDASSLYRADVLDRMLAINYEKSVVRVPETQLYALVHQHRNRFLSAVVQLAQKALTVPVSSTPQHRLTEWYHCGIVCGLTDPDFQKLSNGNQELVQERLPLLDAMECYIKAVEAYQRPITGMELHAEIQAVLTRQLNFTLIRQIPDSWRKMARVIRQHAELFSSKCGLTLSDSGSNLVIRWIPQVPRPLPASSPSAASPI
jgi:hypothetical protein